MPANPRAAAAGALAGVLEGRSLSRTLPDALSRTDPGNRALVQQLCYGTLRDYHRLRALLDNLLDKPLKSRDTDLLALLLTGLYQLEHSRIPPHASVSETVAAAGALGKGWSRGLINAILRRFQREREDLLARLSTYEVNAHPRWYIDLLCQEWPDHAAGVIESNNLAPPMTLRVNQQRFTRDAWLEQLTRGGIAARPGRLSPQAVYLDRAIDVSRLPGFDEGAVSVQDEAAQLAAPALGALAGERILDACAAPGGKTCHILESLSGRPGRIVALDSDASRQERTRQNLDRLGFTAELLTGDAAQPPETLNAEKFDRILVDAPCSGSGVVRRHPDIKLLRRPEDLVSLSAIQLSILRGVWPLLGSEGRLLYVTCSIFGEENSAVIERFLAETPDAKAAPVEIPGGLPADHGSQILPGVQGPDGLFFSLMIKHQ